MMANNFIYISGTTIKNVQFIIQTNQSLIEVNMYDKFYFNFNYLINNSCISKKIISCYLINLT